MKTFALALLASVSVANSAPLMPSSYSLICSGKSASGFNWQSNDWVKANFKPETYIVVVSENNKCWEKFDSEIQNLGENITYRNIYINIRTQGTEYDPILSDKCTEYYFKAKSGDWSSSFSCDGIISRKFTGKFDGWFHKSAIHSDFDKQKNYKDSMYIEVGTCSRIM